MFQVLLVDDEPLVHHDLRTLVDWNTHGFEICGQAQNGVMALTMIEQDPPHIVIIDVDMPEMNGVELNRAIKERFPWISTIVLSSYDEYDYVRDCLRNGSIDYLLKHRLDESALLSILKRAVMELQNEEQNLRGHASEKAKVEKRNPGNVRKDILDLLQSQKNATVDSEVQTWQQFFYPQASHYMVATLQIVPFFLLTESYSDMKTHGLIQQVVDMMQQSLGDIHKRTAVYVEDGRFVIMFAFQERSEHLMQLEADGQLRKIQHTLELFLNLRCITALGHICTGLSQLPGSYRSALRIMDGSSPQETSSHTIIDSTMANKSSGRQPQRVSLTIEEHKQILLAIERFDKEGVSQYISSIFSSIKSQPVHSPTVQIMISELIQIGDKALNTWMPGDESARNELPSKSELAKLTRLVELEHWLHSYFSRLFNVLKPHRIAGSYSRHVTQAIHFILERYPGYVTLELAAGSIGLNSSYLSRLFKEETQRTFSEYLNRVRINAGCKLLESGQYSIKEISVQVGFTTHNYFFKVFKEITGMTPQEYLGNLGQAQTKGN
ncbi:response regulator [Paenibacillus xylanilyticus]|uniref:Response regulator n=1 Tax=Paenibacillus xylanilyticus TaxID=248903 RepID=A0A7Y6EWV4_9BACL|nr:response regulator [Paenibacillus xylanilyticus]NUU76840.1 response regulator [Paenibacillus xylanilyticus]